MTTVSSSRSSAEAGAASRTANRLVARGLEREWEESLKALDAARAELARRENERPRMLTQVERDSLLALGPDLAAVWHAPTRTPRARAPR